jgi:hypothetical protein
LKQQNTIYNKMKEKLSKILVKNDKKDENKIFLNI